MALDAARRHPRPTTPWPEARGLKEPDDARSMRRERREQLKHSIVGRVALGGQGPGDEMRQVVVADGHRVCIAEGPERHLGRRPGSDAGHRQELPAGVG